jgi:hypothetical protein
MHHRQISLSKTSHFLNQSPHKLLCRKNLDLGMLANSYFITGVFPINLERNFIPFFYHDTVVEFL